MKRASILCCLLVLLGAAGIADRGFAQEASVPPMDCRKPKVPERFSVARDDLAYLEKQAGAYGDCVRRYVDERNRQIQQLEAMAKAEAEAGNAATIEVNDLFAKVKALEDRNKPEHEEYEIGK